MNWIKQINDTLNYIEDHLYEDVTLDRLAEICICSKSHLSKMFLMTTGMGIMEYIRGRRLTKAVVDLKRERKVIDVALDCGYETPEAFTKAFKKFHKIPPSKVAHYEGSLQAMMPLSFSLEVKGDVPMNYKIMNKEAFDVVGIKKSVTTEDGANFKIIPAFWQEVMMDGSFEKIAKSSGPLGTMGVMKDYNPETGIFNYYIACEGQAVEGLETETFQVPQGKYAVFTSVGPLPEAIQATTKKIYSEFFPGTEYEHAGTVELEVYLPGDTSKDDYTCEIWVPVK